MTTQTWLVTGTSSGFGLSLARLLLAKGHAVIATSRNPAKTPEAVEEITSHASGRGRWLQLDVTWPQNRIEAALTEATSHFGPIDVLVNNAGFSVLGAVEEIDEDKARREFETNFWGPLRLIRAVLPSMRQRHQQHQPGAKCTIVNISSIAGISVSNCGGLYSASKFALEAMSEALSAEVAEWGIRVLVVEPGAFRTNFLQDTNSQFDLRDDSVYASGMVGKAIKLFQSMNGAQKGDPEKAVKAIFDAVVAGVPASELGKVETLRLMLGEDCLTRVERKVDDLKKNLEASRDVGMQCALSN